MPALARTPEAPVRLSYSQRKNRTASAVHSAVSPSITQTGTRMFPMPMPRKAFFIMVRLWVRGKKLTTFCIAVGITSRGSVVPEKISIGK